MGVSQGPGEVLGTVGGELVEDDVLELGKQRAETAEQQAAGVRQDMVWRIEGIRGAEGAQTEGELGLIWEVAGSEGAQHLVGVQLAVQATLAGRVVMGVEASGARRRREERVGVRGRGM